MRTLRESLMAAFNLSALAGGDILSFAPQTRSGGRLDPAHLLFGQAAQASVAGHLHALNRMRRAQSLDEIALHQFVGDKLWS